MTHLHRIALIVVAAFAFAPAAQATVGFYNYGAVPFGERPGIGRFVYDGSYRRDGIALEAAQVPWVGPAGTIKSPSAVRWNGRVYLYFAGFDGSKFGVGLAVMDSNGRLLRVLAQPVLASQPTMGPYGGEMPRIVIDRADTPARRFKMWLAADPAVGYATSPDGIRWTYRGAFELPAAAFNQTYRFPGAVVRDSGWWWLFTQEYNGRWSTDVLRSRKPMGPFVRLSGSAVVPARDAQAAVTVAAGDTVVTATGFRVGEPVYLLSSESFDNLPDSQLNRIAAVNGGQVTLARPASGSFSVMRSWAFDQYATHVWKERGLWRMIGTGFHAGPPREHTVAFTARSLAGPWVPVTGMPLWPGSWTGEVGPWWTSSENPVLVG